MGRSRHFLLLIFIVGASLLVGIGFEPCITALAAPPAGPDFRLSESALSHPLRIIAYGDMRFTDPVEVLATNPKVRRWLVNQIAAEKPDAVLLSGDVPWHGSQVADYDEFRRETQIWRDAHLRIYPALGNHELSGDKGVPWSLDVSGELVECFPRVAWTAMVFRADGKFRLCSQP